MSWTLCAPFLFPLPCISLYIIFFTLSPLIFYFSQVSSLYPQFLTSQELYCSPIPANCQFANSQSKRTTSQANLPQPRKKLPPMLLLIILWWPFSFSLHCRLLIATRLGSWKMLSSRMVSDPWLLWIVFQTPQNYIAGWNCSGSPTP